jgi:hypothetical protein
VVNGRQGGTVEKEPRKSRRGRAVKKKCTEGGVARSPMARGAPYVKVTKQQQL